MATVDEIHEAARKLEAVKADLEKIAADIDEMIKRLIGNEEGES